MPSSKTAPSSRNASAARSLAITAGGLAALFLYLILPTSSASRSFPIRNLKAFPEEWKIFRAFPDPVKRLELYSRLNHSIPKMFRELPPEAVVLLPPQEYLLRFLPLEQTHWAEPRTIYYTNFDAKGESGPLNTVIWGRDGVDSATIAVLLGKSRSGEAGRVAVTFLDMREPGAWDRVEAAYGPESSGPESPRPESPRPETSRP